MLGVISVQKVPPNRTGQASNMRATEIDLRILATSDLHAHLLAWNYHANRICDQRGLSRVASLIRIARAEQPQSLLFDNGDFLHGSVLGDAQTIVGGKKQSGRPLWTHPVITSMNALGYDAVTLGNHEFGAGLNYLRRALAAAQFKVVSSNLYFKPTRGPAISQTHLLLERRLTDRAGQSHIIKIGVLGFLPPQTMTWEGRHLRKRASIEDIVASAEYWVPELRRAGADVVIALSHSGLGQLNAGPCGGAENASAGLMQVAGLDALIAGHTHLVVPQLPVQTPPGIPTVMPGFYGSHLGVIDLCLRKNAQGWQVSSARSEARPISRRDTESGKIFALVGCDPEILKIAVPAHEKLLAMSEIVIGRTEIAMNSYFALTTDTPALRIVTRAQSDHFRRVMAESPLPDLPILSAAAPFKAGGRGGPQNYTDVPVGPILSRHVNDLYLHPNSLATLRVTGACVLLWLERSVSLYHQIPHGAADAALISLVFPSFNYEMIDGVSYQVDLSQPPMFDAFGTVINRDTRRIIDFCYQGQPIPPDKEFALVTNSYRAAGGLGFEGARPANTIYEADMGTRDILAEYLRGGAQITPADFTPSWSFKPMPGTSVVFETSPIAASHLDEVPQLRLEPLDLLPSGFRRFRLRL